MSVKLIFVAIIYTVVSLTIGAQKCQVRFSIELMNITIISISYQLPVETKFVLAFVVFDSCHC